MIFLSQLYKEIREKEERKKLPYRIILLGGILFLNACASPYISHRVNGNGKVDVYCDSHRCEVHGGAYVYGHIKNKKREHKARAHYWISIGW